MQFLTCLILTLSTLPIHTTVSDNSEVSFFIQTPVYSSVVSNAGNDYIRLEGITASDSVGYPELPMITCFVAIPDLVTPELEWSTSGETEHSDYPVYSAPEHIISYEYTPQIIEQFTKNPAAYSSTEWWPEERVRVIGETRIFDQRLLQVQIFPVLFRASTSSQSTVSSVSVTVSFDSSQADWSTIGLGPFQDMVEGSPIVGYRPVQQGNVPAPEYFKHFNILTGPSRMPDYVILAASGLYQQCDDAIDDLALHRVALNGFDVALVTTDQVLTAFGGSSQVLSPGMIRDFTEHMWNSWGNGTKLPSYLLLIGDHKDDTFSGEPWFLPTHEYKWSGSGGATDPNWIGNDEWFVYFSHPRDADNAFPDMMVGRLSVKNSPQNDTLTTMISNILAMEQPISGTPLVDNRRRIVRLAGTGEEDDDHVQHYFNWAPEKEWTTDFSGWLGYQYATHYCGDGRWFTDIDGSVLKSSEYRDLCLDEFEDGAGILFYSNHGDFHMFGAGLEWDTLYCPYENHGALDSTVNCIKYRPLIESTYHSAPFVLMLCCAAGTFNHTEYLHENRHPHLNFCLQETTQPLYDFSTDCLAEVVLKNTECSSAGVFCGALSSTISYYGMYGTDILEGIYAYGNGRLGNSIAFARTQNLDYFSSSPGHFIDEMGQFNLLGDPALDITDRVRYPNKCDLLVYTSDLDVSPYPRETDSGFEEAMSFTVRNNGRVPSGAFDLRITVSDDYNSTTRNIPCSSLAPGGELTCDYTWTASWFDPPSTLTVTAHADPTGQCDDSWIHNNSASLEVTLNDIYPMEQRWPIETEGVVGTTPLLVNIDSDPELEVVAISGSRLWAWNHLGRSIWSSDSYPVNSQIPPLAADFDGDGQMEIAVVSNLGDDVYLFDGNGTLLSAQSIPGVREIAAGDMCSEQGIELVAASGSTIYLYEWASGQFNLLDSETFTYAEVPQPFSLSCSDLGGDSYAEAVFCSGWSDNEIAHPAPTFYSIAIHDWENQQTLSNRTWFLPGGSNYPRVHPASGMLAGNAVTGFPQGKYDVSSPTDYPALLLPPTGSAQDECERSLRSAHSIKYAMFADWNPLITGADAFVLPSETQSFAWDRLGGALGTWPAFFSDYTLGLPVCPPALGDLDGVNMADVLTATVLDGYWQVLAYDRNTVELGNLGFPIIMPPCADDLGGFAVADIDLDGEVEVVFGSSDGLLQCWELGSCASGYSPWPQYQHDSGRSGALE
jgi:hypothetical protein